MSSQSSFHKGIILAGHGAIPTDYARELVTRLRTFEAQRRTAGGEPTAEEQELETRLRHWPRTPQTDPYQSGWHRSRPIYSSCCRIPNCRLPTSSFAPQHWQKPSTNWWLRA